MERGQHPRGGGASAFALAEPAQAQVRAVAFEIEGKIYAGRPGESHGALYAHLKKSRIVPQGTLDAWTACEEDHGFVTRAGEFLRRAEAYRQFGVARSQDLTAAVPPSRALTPGSRP